MEEAVLESKLVTDTPEPDLALVQSPPVFVAIPAYNEGVAIGSVVLKAARYADEVIVVDDGSTDDTADVADLAGATVIRHARNLGKGMAIRSAWLYARKQGPGTLVLLDGDLQHEPRDIPRFVAPIAAGEADVMVGVRWGKTSGMPLYRRLGKRFLDHITALGTKDGLLTDSQCGYRAFSSRALATLEPEDAGLGIESQMLVEAQEIGLRIQEVDIEARYDVGGSTVSPARHGLGVLTGILTLVSEHRPLFFFGVPGLALNAIGGFLAVLTLQLYYTTGNFAIGYAFLVVLFAIVGVLSVFMGVVLNVMGRIPR